MTWRTAHPSPPPAAPTVELGKTRADPATPIPTPPAAEDDSWLPRADPSRRASPNRWLVVTAVLVLLAAGGGALWLRDHRSANTSAVGAAATPSPPASGQPGTGVPPVDSSAGPTDSPSGSTTTPTQGPSASAAPAATPFYVVIVASKSEQDGGQGAAQSLVPSLEAAGYPALTFFSGNYESTNCCYWVAAAGPYLSAAQAHAEVSVLRAASPMFSTAYDRCVGTRSECE